jgi:predicted nucleic acid-binding protein
MRVPRIYIETSVFNFCFADNDPEKQCDTLKLFDEIREGKYEPVTSVYVLEELERAPEPKQGNMTALIRDCAIAMLATSDEAEDLANRYIEADIIPEKYKLDAIHIAMATIHGLDVIVSFNFKHIVKRKTIEMTAAVNFEQGYRSIGIYSPTEVVEND